MPVLDPRNTLPEDLLLLCADPRTGLIKMPVNFASALTGAVLAEALATGEFSMNRHGITKHEGTFGEPPRHPALATVHAPLTRLAKRRTFVRPRAVIRILQRHCGAEPYLTTLLQRGVLRTEQVRHLRGAITQTRCYAVDPDVLAKQRALTDTVLRLQQDAPIMQDTDAGTYPHQRTLLLAALAVTGGVKLYPGAEGRPSRRRLRELTAKDPRVRAVRGAVWHTRLNRISR
jgi:hypothetical protein